MDHINLGAFWWRNMQIRDPSDDEIEAPWWPDGEIGGPRPLIPFKRFNTAPLHSFKIMYGPKISLSNFRCHASWKRIHGVQILHCSCDDYQFLILVFSVIYLNSWGYIGWGPVRVFEKFHSLSFFTLFSIFHFIFHFCCLSLGGPICSGSPGHWAIPENMCTPPIEGFGIPDFFP